MRFLQKMTDSTTQARNIQHGPGTPKNKEVF